MSRRTSPDWVVSPDGATFWCMRCNRCERVVLPMSITIWCAVARAMVLQHRRCRTSLLWERARFTHALRTRQRRLEETRTQETASP